MKKIYGILIVCFLLCLLSNETLAQWSLCTTPGYSPRQALAVVNDSIVFAAGNDGKVWKSTDNGVTWTISYTDTTKSILGMYFLNADTGFVCGVAGKMFKTTNGGQSWTSVTSGSVVDLYDVEFVSTTTGFAVGLNGTIRKTNNGGISWSSMTSGTSSGLLAIDMVSATEGFIVGSTGMILRTSNGTTWTQLPSNVISSLNDVRSIDGVHVFVCGSDARFLLSDDAGATWQASYLDATYPDLYAIDFLNNDTGMVAGQYGKLFSTNDGGASWIPEASVTGSLLLDLKISSCNSFSAGTGGTVVRKTCGTLNASAAEQVERIDIFPIPAVDVMNIQTDPGFAIAKLVLSDMTGLSSTIDFTSERPGHFRIDTRKLARGTYSLTLVGNEIIRKKIILIQ
ncbi:MAG: YCF48-related protein [Bacteroidota bacterium]